MADDKHWQYIIGGIGVIVVAGMVASASGKQKRKPFKQIYHPGDSIDAWMGQMFTVRLPRGDYQVVSEQIVKNVENDIGNSTDILLLAQPAHAPYQETVRFVALGAAKKEYEVQVSVQPIPTPTPKGGG